MSALARLLRLPPELDAAAFRDDFVGATVGGGEAMGDDGADAVARRRLCEIRLSNVSS